MITVGWVILEVVSHDPAMEQGRRPVASGDGAEADEKLRAVIVAGHRGDAATVRRLAEDPSARVRAAALGALGRAGALTVADVVNAVADLSPEVRRRACDATVGLAGPGSRSVIPRVLIDALGDPDPLVVEAACYALGERRVRTAVAPLSALAGQHPDTRCREAAIAALGAIGDPLGLPAVLGGLADKPTVRRRVVVALAAFEGPEVEAALEVCKEDRDWQVRQAVDMLLR